MAQIHRWHIAWTVVCVIAAAPAYGGLVADLESLSPAVEYKQGIGGGHYENGTNLSGSFASGGAVFFNNYNADWGTWAGWSYSNTIDTFTAGYGNQYSAYALVGAHGRTNYAVGFGSPAVSLPGRPLGAHITNTTYAALAMIQGDSFAKKFGGDTGADPDYFLLTITGRDSQGNETGRVPFYLADYRHDGKANDYIVRDWTWVDLTDLGTNTMRLEFALSSSDNGSWGMNTPAYFAMDNLTTAPEPGTAVLFALGGAVTLAGYGVRRKVVRRSAA